MYLTMTAMGAMAGALGGTGPGAALGGGGGFQDPRATALTSIVQSFAASSSDGGDAEVSLRQALTRALEDRAHDVGQKLTKR
jgi:hypothetical protein